MIKTSVQNAVASTVIQAQLTLKVTHFLSYKRISHSVKFCWGTLSSGIHVDITVQLNIVKDQLPQGKAGARPIHGGLLRSKSWFQKPQDTPRPNGSEENWRQKVDLHNILQFVLILRPITAQSNKLTKSLSHVSESCFQKVSSLWQKQASGSLNVS